MGIGIRLKLGNVNVKEWESTAWEREGMGVKNPFPVIYTSDRYLCT